MQPTAGPTRHNWQSHPQTHHQEPPMGLVLVLIAILLAGTATSASLRRYV